MSSAGGPSSFGVGPTGLRGRAADTARASGIRQGCGRDGHSIGACSRRGRPREWGAWDAASYGSISARHRASARPTRCSPRRTAGWSGARTASSASSSTTAGRAPRSCCTAWNRCARTGAGVPRRRLHRDGRGRGARPPARRRPGGRARAHQRAGLAQRQALAGRRGAAARPGSTSCPRSTSSTWSRSGDVVESITGVRQRETVPDEVVRRADQIELVDMSPQALRRRMAHGNIYKPDKVDAALSNYFRPGNLTALRELALLWVADRVGRVPPAVPGRARHPLHLAGPGADRRRPHRRTRGAHAHPARRPDGRQGLRQRDPRRLHRPQRRTDLRLAQGAGRPADPRRGPRRHVPPRDRRRRPRRAAGLRPRGQRHPDRARLQPPHVLAVHLRARRRRHASPATRGPTSTSTSSPTSEVAKGRGLPVARGARLGRSRIIGRLARRRRRPRCCSPCCSPHSTTDPGPRQRRPALPVR